MLLMTPNTLFSCSYAIMMTNLRRYFELSCKNVTDLKYKDE